MSAQILPALHDQAVSESSSQFSLAVLIGIISLAVGAIVRSWRKDDNLPSVGSHFMSGLFSATKHRQDLLKARELYPKQLFRVSIFPFGNMVVANGSKLIDEIRTGPDDAFSPAGAVEKFVQSEYTSGKIVHEHELHKPIVRNQLTRNAGAIFADLVDEMDNAFEYVLDLPANGDWKSFTALETFRRIFGRTVNRVFTGLPLCRNEEYQQYIMDYATQVMGTAYLINMFPVWTHPVIGRLVGNPNKYVNRVAKILGPTIEERWKGLKTYGKDWADKPHDFLMWVMEGAEASPEEILKSTESLVTFMLFINFASIHTTSMQFTHAIYDIATRPELVEPLRQEAKAILEEYGWSKVAMDKMRKMDSFLRESARFGPTNMVLIPRLLTKDWTFSDGTTVKKGTFVAASTFSTHYDEKVYPNATTFDPWRFIDENSATEENTDRFTSTSSEFLSFGAGKHACPGRFFAANTLKAMVSLVVLNYDVAFDVGASRPADNDFGNSIIPNSSAKLRFRLRKDGGLRPSTSKI